MLERFQVATPALRIQTWTRGESTAIGLEPRTQKASVITSRRRTSQLVSYVSPKLLLVNNGELTHLKKEEAQWNHWCQNGRSKMWHTFLRTGYPGPPSAPKVASTFKDHIDLTWSCPCDNGGTKILGYNLEKKKKGTNYWSLVNQRGPITGTQHVWHSKRHSLMLSRGGRTQIRFLSTDTNYTVKDVFEGAAYEFRVSAINLSGTGDPSIPCDTVIARDPLSKMLVICAKPFSVIVAHRKHNSGLTPPFHLSF